MRIFRPARWTAFARSAKPVTERDRGAAAVEAAILVPFFVIPLIFGSIDIGRALWVKTQLTNAAREGASYAQYQPGRVIGPASGTNTCAAPNNITYRANQELSGIAAQVESTSIRVFRVGAGAPVPITGCGTATISGDERVRVVAEGELRFLLGFFPIGSITLQGYQEVSVL